MILPRTWALVRSPEKPVFLVCVVCVASENDFTSLTGEEKEGLTNGERSLTRKDARV